MKFMAASGAMDFLFAGSPIQPQQRPALRAFEILILFHSFQASEKLFCFQDSIPEKECEFPVFFLPFGSVFGKKAENKHTAQPVADIKQPVQPGKRRNHLYRQAEDQQRHSELVRPVPDRHEPGKPEQQIPEKSHGASFLS
ncbi:MAG: hypothetical protein IKO25_08550 [Clostridia bacterium]|nr:hypothetical protein [Clostridia bacterium]